MTHKRKGMVKLSDEWCKHLRKYGRRFFWKRHRATEDQELRIDRTNKEELLREKSD